MLFCRPHETTSKAQDVLKLVDAYFHEKYMKWEKIVGVCTDGAPAMLGCRSGFIARTKQMYPDVVGTHFVIHREALASKTLPAAIKNKLAIIIRIVKQVRSIPDCLPSYVKTWIATIKICCFIQMFGGYQKEIC